MHPRALPFALAVVVLGAVAADAEPPPPKTERLLRDTVALSVNNIGLQNALDLSWTRPITTSSNPLLREAHVSAGVTNIVTPSHVRLGVWAEMAPLSVFDVRIGAEPAAYYGTFGSLMSFSSYSDDFSGDARKAREHQAAAGAAGRLYASPALRARAGAIVFLASADFEWWWSSAPGPLFYEPARDTLLSVSGGRMLSVSGLALYGRARTFRPGLSYGLTSVPGAPANRIQKVGGVFVRGLGHGEERRRLAANVFYYLSDPSKRHQMGATLALLIDGTR